ncbi:phytanoyl-CoA dioxygenase family protein [uncultured Chryseobacterium sp.]|uniref:phytanoyl-CoA dioxygenase family protein n=1 Tax=uncultured Chryseobacterium sp. TaxID=259322 RepID=UPI00258CCED9|nr:phytanoyl-CoA dioxygenase family protein [uncultured Chryseobacterium sp.]
MNIPWIESPFYEEELQKRNLTKDQKVMAEEYHKNGFVVLRNFFDDNTIDQVVKDMNEKGYNKDFQMKEQRDDVRIQDFWKHSPSVKKLATDSKIIDILSFLYGRKAVPFQTLNFRVGSQQRAHSDTIHFSSLPPRFMCGVWIALEKIDENNGPVFYYPGSQKLPEYDFSHFKNTSEDTGYKDYIEYEDFIEKIMQTQKIEKMPFHANKGDVLIWSSNIIHGGSKVLDLKSTRYSQVTHYFFEDCIYYTPMLSNMVTRELYLRKGLVDISTGQKAVQSFNGNPVNFVKVGKNKYVLRKKNRGFLSLFKK